MESRARGCKRAPPTLATLATLVGEPTEVGWGGIVSRILALSLVTLLGSVLVRPIRDRHWHIGTGASRRRITISAIGPARIVTEYGVGNLNGR